MNVVFNNPYRILGLTNPVTNKELTKRISDLNTFIECGKPINYPLDFSKSQPLNRNLDSINDAARKIESDAEKLFQSLFWFYQHDNVDGMAIDCLKQGDVKTAYGIWSQQIKKSNEPKFSWLINLCVLTLHTKKTQSQAIFMGLGVKKLTNCRNTAPSLFNNTKRKPSINKSKPNTNKLA